MKNKLFTLSLVFLLVTGCSDKNNTFISSYSSNASLAIIEGIEWDNDSNVNILIANLYYGTAYNGEIHQSVYYDFESIYVSMGTLVNNSFSEIYTYSVDMDEYNSQECGILRDNAKKAKSDDFKLSYTFNLRTLLSIEEGPRITIDNLCFLIAYTQIFKDDYSEEISTFNRKFTATATISNTYFSLSNIEFRWWA